jgi:DASS family divalent anion:Na+ symporter
VAPIARSLPVELGSHPGGKSKDLGGFLLFTAFQANIVISSMFLTGTAVNPLTAQLARTPASTTFGWIA